MQGSDVARPQYVCTTYSQHVSITNILMPAFAVPTCSYTRLAVLQVCSVAFAIGSNRQALCQFSLHLLAPCSILAVLFSPNLLCYRYADVLVHRLLAASLGLAPLPESARDQAGVRALTDNLNTRHRNAQMAGRASVELHTLIFFKNRTIIADARITRVRKRGTWLQ